MAIIGRQEEQKILKNLLDTDKSEFVAVLGRRRVGKTFLIRETFKNNFTFFHTGMANATMETQLKNFNKSLNEYGKTEFKEANNWLDTFRQLRDLLIKDRKRSKKIVFIDEMPWLDTQKSGFLSALEYFWNSWAAWEKNILLIVCGSASSWMINKLLNNHGGLHNRVTRKIVLKPFVLAECEKFYKKENIRMSQQDMAESYMIFGGIPYYLSLFEKEFSLAQNVDNILFGQNAVLQDEFQNLYASLFKNSEHHIKIVEALSTKRKGLTRDELIKICNLSNGGGFNRTLSELELSGFIRSYSSYGKKKKDKLYQLIDFYTLFYFNFLNNSDIQDEHFWTNYIETAGHRAWSGYAFEQLCLYHLTQIKQKLGILGVLTKAYSWRSKELENGVQIDLIIERNDRVINICEMKFTKREFSIDKNYDKELRNKRETFREESKTNNAVHLTMITANGLQKNMYSGNIQSEVTLKDLFK